MLQERMVWNCDYWNPKNTSKLPPVMKVDEFCNKEGFSQGQRSMFYSFKGQFKSLIFSNSTIWEEPSSPIGDDTLEAVMSVDSLPSDPTAMDTLPLPPDFEIPQAALMEPVIPAPAEMPLSEIDKRILELQSFGCLPGGVIGGDHPSIVAWKVLKSSKYEII